MINFAKHLGLLCVCACLSLVAGAQPLADRVPADAVLYVGWQGAEDPGKGYTDSHAAAFFEAAQLRRFIDQLLPQLAAKVAEESPREASQVLIATLMIQQSMKHPGTLFIALSAGGGEMGPPVRFGFVLKAGDQAQKIADVLSKHLPPAAIEERVLVQDGMFMLHMGLSPDDVKCVVGENPASSLGRLEAFTAAMKHGTPDPWGVGYVDGEGMLKLIEMGAMMSGDPTVAGIWPKLRVASGVGSVKRAIWTAGFFDKRWRQDVFVHAPQPRLGLVASMLDTAPLGAQDIAAIPATATAASAFRFDLAALVKGIRDGVADFDPGMKDMVDGQLAAASAMLGFDVDKDLVQAFGDAWCLYSDSNVGGAGIVGMVLVNRAREPEKLATSLNSLMTFITRTITEQSELGEEGMVLAVRRTVVDGTTVHYLTTPLFTPSWAVRDGNLYLGLFPQVVASAAAHVANKGRSIAFNSDYVRLRREVGGRITSFTFADLPRTLPHTYSTVVTYGRLTGFFEMMGFDLPPMIVPPLHQLSPHVVPAASFTWVDDEGWHWMSTEPFPGSTLIGSAQGSGVAVTSMGVGILLPALGAARRTANRVKASTQLHSLLKGIVIYSLDNDGKLPPTLGDLAPYIDSPAFFLYPATETGPPSDVWRRMSAEEKKAWINANSPLVYVRGDGIADHRADRVLVHTPLTGDPDADALAGFADGHVESLKEAELRRRLGR